MGCILFFCRSVGRLKAWCCLLSAAGAGAEVAEVAEVAEGAFAAGADVADVPGA